MKLQLRTIGIDDAPFKFRDKEVVVIGAVLRGKNYIEGVLRTSVKVDGSDATSKLTKVITKSRFRKQIKAIFLDGIALGGFNIIDIKKLYKATKVPVITVTRDKPDLEKIEHALRKHFKDWETRLKTIKAINLVEITTKHNPIYIGFLGITLEEAEKLIAQTTIRGALPEPVRVAHLIACGVVKGESYGRA
ncbi:MAG: DUF99 family protein [Candidatus Thermoplasmatota archaeon]|nr:DUF99 family protein [Candidatus Thermoplasmatota archaeon]